MSRIVKNCESMLMSDIVIGLRQLMKWFGDGDEYSRATSLRTVYRLEWRNDEWSSCMFIYLFSLWMNDIHTYMHAL